MHLGGEMKVSKPDTDLKQPNIKVCLFGSYLMEKNLLLCNINSSSACLPPPVTQYTTSESLALSYLCVPRNKKSLRLASNHHPSTTACSFMQSSFSSTISGDSQNCLGKVAGWAEQPCFQHKTLPGHMASKS